MTRVIRDFTHVQTIYTTKIRTIALKIHRDYVASGDIELHTIGHPGDVYALLTTLFHTLDDDQEHFLMLVLNQAQEVTGYKLLSSGSHSASLVDSKVVFRNALLLGASAIIVAHNHPAGSRTASAPDVAVTRKLVHAGAVLDIHVVDHIIYTAKGSTSLREAMPHLFETPETPDRTHPRRSNA